MVTTIGRFLGDKRDGEAPPLTIPNWYDQAARYSAKALRARLSRLSRAELWRELIEGAAYIKALDDMISASNERVQRAGREAHRRRQAEVASKSRLQADVLLAARHYRDQGVSAKKAWETIRKIPFAADTGNTVEIEDRPPHQWMRVKRQDGSQESRTIRLKQWRNVYWPAAAKPGLLQNLLARRRLPFEPR